MESFLENGFSSFSNTDTIGLVIGALSIFISAAGGIGGGGILLPNFILIMGLDAKMAIPLTNITVLGGAISNVLFNIFKRHPDSNKLLIDWNIIALMEPPTIAGAILGSFVNKVLPGWILILGLISVLGFVSRKILIRGLSMWQQERTLPTGLHRTYAKLSEHETEENEGYQRLTDEISQRDCATKKGVFESCGSFAIVGAVFITTSIVNIMKGGDGVESPIGVECGSVYFWVLNASIIIFSFLAVFLSRHYILSSSEQKCIDRRYSAPSSELLWTSQNTLKYPCLSFFAGLFAGMFGVGGGIIKAPLLLEMGFHPLVASACAATMILFTSASAALSFVIFGMLEPKAAVFLLLFGVFFTAAGQLTTNYLVKVFKRFSVIVLSIGFVIAISAVFLSVQSAMTLISSQGKSLPFREVFCETNT